ADMGRFMIAHLQNGEYNGARILSAATAVQMHTTAQASVGPLNRMMLGFYETTINGHRAIAHGGDTMWFHSDLQLFLDDGIGIYVSTNSAGKDGAARNVRASLVTGFADRYLPLKGGLPASTVDAATARLHAQQLVGAYMSSRRPQSNFMSILNAAGLVQVIANEDGTISVPMLAKYSGAPRKWREVSPYVWRDVDGGDRIAADVVDGKVTRFSADGLAAIMVFQRQPAWMSLLVPLSVASLLALLLTVLAWPVSALVRRRYGVRYGLSGSDARAHRVVRIAALLVLASVIAITGMVVAMLTDLNLMTPSMDGGVIALRLFALVALPLGAVVGLWNAWSVLRSGRSRWAKLW
ncbi:MAG: serine hydrolase, partial [Comamonadaceae bacterium]